jgi:hypothetical protein
VVKEANECFVQNVRNRQMSPTLCRYVLPYIPFVLANTIASAVQIHSMIAMLYYCTMRDKF